MSEWIPVTLRLPAHSEFYTAEFLVTGVHRQVYLASWNGSEWIGDRGYEITHWMPKPDAPKQLTKHEALELAIKAIETAAVMTNERLGVDVGREDEAHRLHMKVMMYGEPILPKLRAALAT